MPSDIENAESDNARLRCIVECPSRSPALHPFLRRSEDTETFIPVLLGEGSLSRGIAVRVDLESLPQYVSRYIRSTHHENGIFDVRSPVL
jgi:hypothetical protein